MVLLDGQKGTELRMKKIRAGTVDDGTVAVSTSPH